MANIKTALLPVVLCSLASNGDVAEIRKLYEQDGVNLNVCDYDMRCALHLAVCEGMFDLVKYLVDNGAVVNAKDRWGHTPYSEAIRCGYPDIAEYLEIHGANTQE
ncbi:Ankyrin repeats (3 copies) [compost metagenome]